MLVLKIVSETASKIFLIPSRVASLANLSSRVADFYQKKFKSLKQDLGFLAILNDLSSNTYKRLFF